MKAIRLFTILSCAACLGAPTGAEASTPLRPCSDARSALCGTVTVPVDRSSPALGTMPIFFRVVRHTGSGPAKEPIVTTEGGPGYSVTQNNWTHYRDYVFAPLRRDHDLVFIDQRGAGLSDPINCSSIQGGVSGDLYTAFAQCASHLGAAANDYGSGDVALDIDALRAVLGIDRFDFYGGSYAAADIQAYAARFAEHLKAVVLDSPVQASQDDLARSAPSAIVRAVTLVCRRSASCSADHPRAGQQVGWLARRLRRHPVVGTGIDSTGKRHRLRVTEAFLAWRIAQNTNGPFVIDAELAAAASALRAGDDVPLLRLAADSAGPLIGPFSGDSSSAPSAFSGGDNTARFCTDASFPWRKDASTADRQQEFDAAVAALPPNTFKPFSVGAWLAAPPTGLIGPDPCIAWPAPAASTPPPVPAGARFPAIPALVLSGDLDSVQVPSADARKVAGLFPRSTFVELADSGHHTVFSSRSDCSTKLVQRFLSSFTAGNTACARSTAFVFPAVGRFPRTAADTSPATVSSRGTDRSTPIDRKVAAAAGDSLKDVLDHALLTNSDGVGLRGGSYRAQFAKSGLKLKLHAVRFTSDVTTTGRAAWSFSNNVATARFTVHGPAREAGRLTVRGTWLAPGAGKLTITGTLNAHTLALTIPAT